MTHATEQDVIAAAEDLLRTLDELDAEDAKVVAAAESGRGAANVVALPGMTRDARGKKETFSRSGDAASDKSTEAPSNANRIVELPAAAALMFRAAGLRPSLSTEATAIGDETLKAVTAREASAAVVPGEDEDVVIVTIPHAAEGISKG